MARKNIVILASTFPRWPSDTVPSFVLDFASAIAHKVGSITVVAPHFEGAKRKDSFEPGIAVRRFRYAFPYKYENAAYGQFKKTKFYPVKMVCYVIAEFYTTLIACIRTRPTVINAHWLIPQGFVAVLVGRLVNARVIISVHGSDVFTLNGKYMRKVKRFTLRHAEKVVVNSSATQRACNELLPGDYPIVPMGIDVKKFDLPKRRRKQYEVIFVGRLAPHKGAIYLCEALCLLHKRMANIHLTIVGDGPERAAIEQFIVENNLHEVISLTGWVQPNGLPELMSQADIFVGPSVEGSAGEKEALGLVFAEASAAGLPVIGTDVGGIKDIVKDNVTGILVPQKDAKAIGDALEYLQSHPKEAEEMGSRGRDFVRANFSWDSVASRYLRILNL